jgi:hypothetical protein
LPVGRFSVVLAAINHRSFAINVLKSPTPKNSFYEHHQADCLFTLIMLENFSFVFSENVVLCSRPASARGAYRDRHDTRGGMRWPRHVAACALHADERHGADGEVVWFWHPGADAKFVMLMTGIVSDRGKTAGP